MDRLASERVVIAAPFSFSGSAQRIWRVGGGWFKPLLAVVIGLAWLGVLCWYCLFGLLLVPYRLIRRGSRKRKAEVLRHRELMGS